LHVAMQWVQNKAMDYCKEAEKLWDEYRSEGFSYGPDAIPESLGRSLRQVFCTGFRTAIKVVDMGGTDISATRAWEEMQRCGEFVNATPYDVWRMAWGVVFESMP